MRLSRFGGHISGGLAGATYRVALEGHIFGGLAGTTYRVVLGVHIFGGLAAATYRVATYTSHVHRACTWRARLRRDCSGDAFTVHAAAVD